MIENRQMIMPEGYHGDNIREVIFQARERKQVIPASILSISYPENVPTWELGFRDFPDYKGLVPFREMGVEEYLVTRFMGQDIQVNILGIDHEFKNIVCSRKSVVDKFAPLVQENLRVAQKIKAVIKAILPRTRKNEAELIVDIGGGLLVSISSEKSRIRLSKRLDEQYIVGQVLDVLVMGTEPIEVSIKDLLANPWETTIFNRGQFLSGTIINIADNIAFIEPDLAPGIVGIAPIPIAGTFMKYDRVSCFVVTFDNEKESLRLNIKSRVI